MLLWRTIYFNIEIYYVKESPAGIYLLVNVTLVKIDVKPTHPGQLALILQGHRCEVLA